MSETQIEAPTHWAKRSTVGLWERVKDFSGLGGDATYLWPRWIVLRAVGVVYIFVFGGVIHEAQALIGPDGIVPVASLFAHLQGLFPNSIEPILRAPSLLWISSGAGMITALGWLGMAAAVALVLNLWPRMALFACWLIFLSFVTVFGVFSPTVIDPLMLETALLCIPFAPKGLRPGLGVTSPPLPIAIFMVRWLVFRVMFESGLSKFLSGDPHWRDLTAMNVMYETAPFPTFMAFVDHQMPYVYHLWEIFLTYVAELVGPILAIFCGRRGRWIAIIAWFMLQAGIQFTANFGWLNFAAIGVSLLLLDDQMLISLAKRLRLDRLRNYFATTAIKHPFAARKPWRIWLLWGALWTHFVLTIYAFVLWMTLGAVDFSEDPSRPNRYAFTDFRSANPFTPYATFLNERYGVEFLGSNDGGVTWRAYQYPHLPQEPDQIVGHIAPRFLRFQAASQIIGSVEERTPTFPLVALKLLEENQLILDLFKSNPFPDSSPTMIRMRRFQLQYTDWATYRETGNYWTKRYLDDYAPMMYIDADGRVKQASSAVESTRVQAAQGNPGAQTFLGSLYLAGREVTQSASEAKKWFLLAAEQNYAPAQYQLGAMYSRDASGFGVPTEAARWFGLSAEQGWPDAQYQLARLYANGWGVDQNQASAVKWYRQAAMQGQLDAQFMLGVSYYDGRGVPRDLIEGLAWFMIAAESGDASAAQNQAALEAEAGPAGTRTAQDRSKELRALIEPVSSSRLE